MGFASYKYYFSTFQSYLIGWDELLKTKWLIGYILVIAASIIDWTLSISMLCDEVRTAPIWLFYRPV